MTEWRDSIPKIKVIKPKAFAISVVRREIGEQVGSAFSRLQELGKTPTGFAFVVFSDDPNAFGCGYSVPDDRSSIDLPDMVRSRIRFAIDNATIIKF